MRGRWRSDEASETGVHEMRDHLPVVSLHFLTTKLLFKPVARLLIGYRSRKRGPYICDKKMVEPTQLREIYSSKQPSGPVQVGASCGRPLRSYIHWNSTLNIPKLDPRP